MRNVVIRCFFCGSLTFGICAALLFLCFHYYHVSKWQEQTREGTSVLFLDEKLQQPISRGSWETPTPHASVQRPNEDETKEQRPLLKLNKDFNYTDLEAVHGYLKYGFNVVISKSLGKERHVPDTRNKMCRTKHYPARLPTASIIICFHNEEFNALFRTVSSVMMLTPHRILEEIILVDDMSEFGEVLVFLDSHCEVNKVWLEPLLAAIREDHRMVVCPLIDVIDYMTLEYQPSPVVRGAFNWYLQFKWDNVFSYEVEGPEGPTRPIRSPVMAGGIFAMKRHYFNELGQYDKGMNFWGGENLELSLRIWMCGGQLFILPCSRVGHINKQHNVDQTRVIRAVIYNNLRLVHVWLDEYKEQVFLRRPSLRSIPYGNISERVELRKQLGCKSFQWYLETVFPELEASNGSR
ncbi:inactive polypeptide N-acetylgalactosaminyltransferase-like protein 5 isoform X2 [Rhinolophus ferrumequinum]|uniref:Polypeptide N-acetylgalactosaminyltransferase like 5 n=1 Tax=Rhinolophus ferrumequinum TaxID=59479 RepID=A0A671FNF2_RHIFE|nr:inactive polypeptide N-acetylgalactosaminyltransferase-like protein 5 isoform X2 [Rhinolophus ferrumequinum]